jgi:predicted ATPase
MRFLKAASARQTHVLILDDLHWADIPSLLLLQFVTREIREAYVPALATYRDTELSRQHPLVQTLGEMVREPCTQNLHLERLSEADIARFLESATPRLSPTLTAAVYKTTEGNPFFLTEVVRLLVHKSKQASPPDMQAPPPSLCLKEYAWPLSAAYKPSR